MTSAKLHEKQEGALEVHDSQLRRMGASEMEKHELDKHLWEIPKGKATFFQHEGGLVALASCVDVGQRLPKEDFSVYSKPEAAIVLSGEATV